MSKTWDQARAAAGDLTSDQLAQLFLHEVLHVVYSPKAATVDGLLNRDDLAQALVDKFKPRHH